MSELVAITTYFNPCRWNTRRINYDLFKAGMAAAGVPCITVECAFADDDFELPPSLDVIRIRAGSLLWQKERLLNLAASWLPASCRYVAWLDCDVLFDDPRWPADLIAVLGQKKVAQLFETAIRLDRHGTGESEPRARSFASVMSKKPETLEANRYDLHGHTGYAWAMRRKIFDEVGLYESAVSGSADHFMAHAIFGRYGFCVENALKHDARQIAHLKQWGGRFHDCVRGSLGVVPGAIRHLWHGDLADRRYFLRMHDITDLGFDPYVDIVAEPGEPLAWARNIEAKKPGLVAYFANYFASRREDGIPTTEKAA